MKKLVKKSKQAIQTVEAYCNCTCSNCSCSCNCYCSGGTALATQYSGAANGIAQGSNVTSFFTMHGITY